MQVDFTLYKINYYYCCCCCCCCYYYYYYYYIYISDKQDTVIFISCFLSVRLVSLFIILNGFLAFTWCKPFGYLCVCQKTK